MYLFSLFLKMRCCVPFCKNTAENAETEGISFHRFPSYGTLRAAWIGALGKQDTPLADCAVVCSQHFLDDELYDAEDGSRQVCIGAIPSTVQICFVCLDGGNKQFLMSKHSLDEAYEQLTGYPVYDGGNLKQTACIHCVQRLRDFKSFRNESLRVRELMMDLVRKHEIVTVRHIKMINRTKNQPKCNIVKATPPDQSDQYFQQPIAHKETELETVVLKEESIYSMDDDGIEDANENCNNDENEDNYDSDDDLKESNTISWNSKNDHHTEDIEVKTEDDIKINMQETNNVNNYIIEYVEVRHDNGISDVIHLEAKQIDEDHSKIAKSAAERKRKQRNKLKACGLFKELKKNETENRKKRRRLMKQTASIDMLQALRKRKAEEMRRYRNKVKEKKRMLESSETPVIEETHAKAFGSKSLNGKAVAKAKHSLPFSPTKCRAVVHTLARQITPEIITPEHKEQKCTKYM